MTAGWGEGCRRKMTSSRGSLRNNQSGGRVFWIITSLPMDTCCVVNEGRVLEIEEGEEKRVVRQLAGRGNLGVGTHRHLWGMLFLVFSCVGCESSHPH